MYNESDKRRFLSEYINGEIKRSDSTEQSIVKIFQNIEPVELECGMDFAQMNIEDMQRAFNTVPGLRIQSAETAYFLLKQYIRWRAANGMDGRDTFKNLRLDSVEKFRPTAVGSAAHLEISLNAAFPHPELNEIEYVYRAALWLAFLGLDEESAITIRSEDVHFDTMQIDRGGALAPIKICGEALQDLRKACTLTEFIEPRGKNGVIKQRAVGDLILRGKVSNKSMTEFMSTTMRQMINKAFKSAANKYAEEGKEIPRQLSLALSHERIYRSGVCFRAYELERLGADYHGEITLVATIEFERKLAADAYTLTKHRSRGKIRNVVIKRYLDDYALWKCAFTV